MMYSCEALFLKYHVQVEICLGNLSGGGCAIFGELEGVIVVGKNFDAVINCGWGLDYTIELC